MGVYFVTEMIKKREESNLNISVYICMREESITTEHAEPHLLQLTSLRPSALCRPFQFYVQINIGSPHRHSYPFNIYGAREGEKEI